jgi:hypothetical protein
MRDGGEVFLVEIKYADLVTIVPRRSDTTNSQNP